MVSSIKVACDNCYKTIEGIYWKTWRTHVDSPIDNDSYDICTDCYNKSGLPKK